MNKRVKENEVVCDSCGFYKDKFFINKHKSGKNYCSGCIVLGIKAQEIKEQVNPKEVDKLAKALLNTPPRKRIKKGKQSQITKK
jgi:late competence protein required for DNA uptake (superfamily II DNA/RNA helicase)